jgi:glycosyltransferase involved in cell wall biosynthesis
MAVADSRAGVGDQAVLAATGKHPDAWFRLLDAQNAPSWRHADIAAWLVRDHNVDPWWSQNLTVRYEQARGMRAPGQMADGTCSVSASRTLVGDKQELLDRAVEVVREHTGADPASVRPDAGYATARWKLENGALLVTVNRRKTAGRA